ncbi:MAG: hypothetical protein LBU14_01250 [Candidatus Peribacteria bacterium]|nr:hypothetical protein [Candidatus Peribacteria bacterium]
MLFQVVITLIVTSKPVLSHFSSTVFALSCVKAEVFEFWCVLLLSSFIENASISQISNLIGFNEKTEDFQDNIFELALVLLSCQSSAIGFKST